MRLLRLAAVLMVAQAAASCFFYDSRWGQAEAEQRRTAKRSTPAALSPAKRERGLALDGRRPSELRTLRLRAYATPAYVSETLDWQRNLADTIDAANSVFADLGVRVALERASNWRPKASSGTLETTLAELRGFDAGSDVDFVLGLCGSLPRVEFSFHQLGMAGLLGKHLVVRAMNDAAEFAAIHSHLKELDETERLTLYQERKRHKNASVLLHEIGHALGALHVNDPKELMHPTYSPESSGFGPETRALLAISLRRPDYATDGKQQNELVEEALKELRSRPAAAWVPGERENRIAALERMRSRTPTPRVPLTPAPIPTAARPSPEPARSLTAEERATLEEAWAHLRAKRHREAWSAAEPLFERYPKDYAVQELRCKVASELGLPWQETLEHCRPMMSLTPGMPESFR